MSPRRAISCGALAVLCSICCVSPTQATGWSPPAALSLCPPAGSARVVFPSSRPQVRSGPGAILWSDGPMCGASSQALIAALSGSDQPESARVLSSADRPAMVDAATGTAAGQLLLATVPPRGGGTLLEGPALGTLDSRGVLSVPAEPTSAFSAYLGDAAVSWVQDPGGRPSIALRIQRYFAQSPGSTWLLPTGDCRTIALAATMDFRSEALVAWACGGRIFAQQIAQSGKAGPRQLIGLSSGTPYLQALLSDDGHGIVAWQSRDAAAVETRLSISGPHARFGGSERVTRFEDPDRLVPATGAMRLVRLSTGAVVMAWTQAVGANDVVRASPLSLSRGVFAPVTVSGNEHQAILSDLAPGPDGEALALWSEAPRLSTGQLDRGHTSIMAARGAFANRDSVAFGRAEPVASAGLNGPATAAIDPATDRVVATWAVGGLQAGLDAAVRTP
jgi:hypothetical protein